MPAGRPTKYEGEATLKKTEEFLKGGFATLMNVIPTIEGLAEYLGVACSTVELWATKYEDFSGALERIKKKQKDIIINRGLDGEFNPTIAKLILSANHDVRETQVNINQNTEVPRIVDDVND